MSSVPVGTINYRPHLTVVEGGKIQRKERTRILLSDTLLFDETAGVGPDIDLRDIILVPDPSIDWTGKAVMEVSDCKARVRGLAIDVPKMTKPPAYGLVLSTNFQDGSPRQSGGAGSVESPDIYGQFTRSCIFFDSGEEWTVISPNLTNREPGGWGVIFANGIERSQFHSMTDVVIIGATIKNYRGAGGYLARGECQQISIIGGCVNVNGPLVVVEQRGQDCVIEGVRHETVTPQVVAKRPTASGWVLSRTGNHPGASFPL